jgi:hypothetical protein
MHLWLFVDKVDGGVMRALPLPNPYPFSSCRLNGRRNTGVKSLC